MSRPRCTPPPARGPGAARSSRIVASSPDRRCRPAVAGRRRGCGAPRAWPARAQPRSPGLTGSPPGPAGAPGSSCCPGRPCASENRLMCRMSRPSTMRSFSRGIERHQGLDHLVAVQQRQRDGVGSEAGAQLEQPGGGRRLLAQPVERQPPGRRDRVPGSRSAGSAQARWRARYSRSLDVLRGGHPGLGQPGARLLDGQRQVAELLGDHAGVLCRDSPGTRRWRCSTLSARENTSISTGSATRDQAGLREVTITCPGPPGRNSSTSLGRVGVVEDQQPAVVGRAPAQRLPCRSGRSPVMLSPTRIPSLAPGRRARG